LRVSDAATLSAITKNSFTGGNIFVNANSLEITNGGQFLTTAYSSGPAGKITINANDSVKIAGSDPSFETRLDRFGEQTVNTLNSNSGLFANTEENSTAQGGSIMITAPQLIVQNGAQVAVDSSGSGNAGSIDAVTNSIRLENQATLNANTSGNEGNIRLRTNELILSHDSDITTNATGENVIGGNIDIDTNVLGAFSDSDISANSENFRGGKVRVNAISILGTQSRAVATFLIDITATGGAAQFSGTVEINTPNIDPSRGLEKLPTTIVDAERLVRQNICVASQGSEFIITGRGGLPESPQQTQLVDTGWEDWRMISDNSVSNQELRATRISSSINSSQISKRREKIVEATGWVIDSQGDVILTEASVITAQASNFNSLNCHT
jgi:large exoprotein involved in heme utilization and adhesion